MSEIFNIFYEVKANVNEAVASFGTVDKELGKMQKSGEIASAGMLKMEKASKYAGIALMAVGGAFASVAAVGIKAAIEVAGAQAKLSTAVKDTGVSFEAFKPYMESSVESMAKLNFTAGDTMTALAQLTAATRSPQKAIDVLGATADLAAFQHETLAQAADTVSRAAMGQARGLGDLGIALGKTIPKGATVAQIMQAIQERTKGAALEAAKADPWKQLTVQFGLMEEKLGTALLPTFKKLSNWIVETGIPALEKMGKWIGDNKGLFEGLVATLAALWVAPKIAGLLTSLGLLATAFTGVGTAATEAAAAETAAFSVGVPEVLMAFIAAWGAYKIATKSVPAVAGGIKNMGITAASGGAFGGSTGKQSVTPSGRHTVHQNTKTGPVTMVVEGKDVAKYVKQGWIDDGDISRIVTPTKTSSSIKGADNLNALLAANAKKTSTKAKTKGAGKVSVKQAETGTLTVNVNYDGSKKVTTQVLYGGK